MPQDKADARIIDYDIGRKPLPDILADYRQWISMQEDRIGTHSPDCHLWPRHERCMIHLLAAEVQRLRLTDSERAAIERAVKDENDFGLVYTADVLQSLLDRLSP
jgi:hypothetical protein